ncbi:MAG: AMP-binding protein, partial [Anaerolineales bacterium]|nr:AMP-binding protein [Anaerolineales bacterium]
MPAPRDANMPLSFAQERLWVLDQLVVDRSAYHVSNLTRLQGPLRPDLLARSVRQVVRRHETLRTTFVEQDGQPVQIIHPDLACAWTFQDFRHLPQEEREQHARQWAVAELRQPFDLTTGPLLRVSLLQLAAQEYVLIFTMHHIISDGWSIGILKEEVSALYAAFLHDRPDPLPELPIQYADFASWQRAWLQDAVLEDHLAYWKRKLTGFSPLLELPTDFPRVPRQEMHGKRLYFSLPEELSQAIRNLSQQQSVTTFVTMLAALNVLFFRYTGQTDILIGVPASSRNHNLLKKLIGIFVNTLVLRSDLSGDPPFLQLLHQVHETSTGALAHQDVPFEQVVEMMQPARELANSPLFQVMFAFQNAPRSGLSLPDVEAGFFLRERETTVFDMTLLMWDVDQALQGAVEYDASLFRDDTISRMLAHFQVLLQAIVTTPNVAISRLPLLTSPQREERLSQATVTRVTHPAQTVLDLFVAQARRAPRAIAGISPTDTITYARLDAQANQLARQLRKHGAGPDVLVGLCVNRSCQMLVGLLGILKAGSAYVPLDPDYPQARLSFMVEDSGLSILVTGGNNAADLFPDYAGSLIDLDADWPRIAAESSADLPLALAADNVAYLIYTSGSTGRPKGVMASHRGLSNYVQAACRQFDLQPTDRMLQFASLSFDTAAEEIYPILATGGTIILRTDAMMASARTFLEQCATWKITILDLPTAYWHELVAQLETDPIPLPDHLRLVIIGGESANRERVASWQRAVGDDVRLYNTYGPTEATIVTTWQPLVAADAARPIIPIG